PGDHDAQGFTAGVLEQVEPFCAVEGLIPRPVPRIAFVAAVGDKRERHPWARLGGPLTPLIDDRLGQPAEVLLGLGRHARRFIELVDDAQERLHVGPRRVHRLAERLAHVG
ncbi:MAG: hypothetical protein ACK55I_02385, partial [bacterium]